MLKIRRGISKKAAKIVDLSRNFESILIELRSLMVELNDLCSDSDKRCNEGQARKVCAGTRKIIAACGRANFLRTLLDALEPSVRHGWNDLVNEVLKGLGSAEDYSGEIRTHIKDRRVLALKAEEEWRGKALTVR